MAKLFEWGQIVQTAGVNELARKDILFSIFVLYSLNRYRKGDWGDISGEDAELNDSAIKNGDRILAAYIFNSEEIISYCETTTDDDAWTPKKTEEKDPDAVKIWIITEWDRSVTTILFPSEY